ncbi:hypothetical protein H0H93_016837 [Arthromyces matolae]|nr:hypothetical protein H0H93_016837 [Arthromyces matolae]
MAEYLDELYEDFIKNRTRGSSKLVPYLKLARWLPLGVHAFMSLQTVLIDIHEEGAEPDNDALHQYNLIMDVEPRLEEFIMYLSKDMEGLTSFVQQLDRTATSAKTDDTSTLRDGILSYLLEDINTNVEPRIPSKTSKAARGFSHPVTARHLCGIKMLVTFDNNPNAFMDSVSEGKLKPLTKHWPSFLYDTDEYDPKDPTKGFMRGFLLLRVYRHIFTGPTSAFTGRRKATKPSKSHIHTMKHVTGRSIAYAAARFALSSCEEWCIEDGNFNLWRFFENIVAIFEDDPDDPWVVDTLEWWDQNVPDLVDTKKRKRCRREAIKLDDPEDDEAVDEMREAMRAKKAGMKSPPRRSFSPPAWPSAPPSPHPQDAPSPPYELPRRSSSLSSPTSSPPPRPQPRPIGKRKIQPPPDDDNDNTGPTQRSEEGNRLKKLRKSQPPQAEAEDHHEHESTQQQEQDSRGRRSGQGPKPASSEKRTLATKKPKARK